MNADLIIEIIPFRLISSSIKILNLEWHKIFQVEPKGKLCFRIHKGKLLTRGIYFYAKHNRCHYWYSFSYKIDDSTFELSKMAVTDGAKD
jgi:hypothetical protein